MHSHVTTQQKTAQNAHDAQRTRKFTVIKKERKEMFFRINLNFKLRSNCNFENVHMYNRCRTVILWISFWFIRKIFDVKRINVSTGCSVLACHTNWLLPFLLACVKVTLYIGKLIKFDEFPSQFLANPHCSCKSLDACTNIVISNFEQRNSVQMTTKKEENKIRITSSMASSRPNTSVFSHYIINLN